MSGAPPAGGLLPGESAPLATVTPTDRRGLVAIATALALVFSLISIVIRAYVRYQFSNSFGTDDAVIAVAFLVSIFQSTTVFIEVSKGFGQTLHDIAPENLPGLQKVRERCARVNSASNITQASYASDILFILSLYLTKCAVVFLFLRLSPDRRHVMASKFILGLTTILTIASIFMISFNCTISHPWLFISSHCTGAIPRWESFAAFDIFTEFLLGLMPLLIVRSLQMSWSKKYIVVMAFSLRLLIMVPIAFRLYYLKREYSSNNPTLIGTWAAIVTQVDVAFAIISATIPCLRPFMAATVTSTAPTDGTRKDSRYAKGSQDKPTNISKNAYGLHSLASRFKNGKSPREEKQLSDQSTQEIYGTNVDHTVSVISPGDQHSVESQDSRQMIIRRDVEWAVTDEGVGTPQRTYSQQGQEGRGSDERVIGSAI
jgi:hypothetical protein